jgi:hypothetical protein
MDELAIAEIEKALTSLDEAYKDEPEPFWRDRMEMVLRNALEFLKHKAGKG